MNSDQNQENPPSEDPPTPEEHRGGLPWWLGLALFWVLLPTVIVSGIQGHVSLMLTALILLVILIMGWIVGSIKEHGQNKKRRNAVWQKGIPGRANITKIGTTGGGINNDPYVDMDLEVSLDDGSPTYEAHITTLISLLAIPRIQPGCEIAVRVDPDDRHYILVDPELTPYRYN